MENGTAAAIYSISTGQANRLDACTENLANSMTPGYRRLIATQGKFDEALRQATGSSSNTGSGMAVDFTPGPCKQTDNPLDMAINGKGFFVVQKDGKEYFTRNGTFSRASDGTLVNSGGLTVASENGNPIRLPQNADVSKLTLDANRNLQAGNIPLGKVRIVTFDNTAALSRVGPALFAAPTGTAALPDTASTVNNRVVEQSNASIFEEMTELVSCTRAQEACQKMIHASDQAETKAIETYSH